MATNYIIFSLARCASTSLGQVLNSLQPGSCIFEPFNVRLHGPRFVDNLNGDGLEGAMRSIFNKYQGIKHVWHPHGWPFSRGSDTNSRLLVLSNCKIIFLARRNIIRRLLSLEIALQSDIWHPTSGAAARQRLAHSYGPIDIDALGTAIGDEVRAIESCRAALRNSPNPWIEIAFEDLVSLSNVPVDESNALGRVLEFTGCNGRRFSTALTRQFDSDSQAVYRCIPNIDEIDKRLSSEITGRVFE